MKFFTDSPNFIRTVDMQPQDILAATSFIPEGSPVYMVNLLRYREYADYRDYPAMVPCSGREAYYERYIPAFNQTVSRAGINGIKVFWLGTVLARVVAPPEEQWDNVAIVEYPDFATFRRVIESQAYQTEADPHRKAALEDWRLIATAPFALPE